MTPLGIAPRHKRLLLVPDAHLARNKLPAAQDLTGARWKVTTEARFTLAHMRILFAVVVLALLGAAFARSHAMKQSTRRVGSAECDICTWVVTQAESMLAQNSTEQDIITELDKARSPFFAPSVISLCLLTRYLRRGAPSLAPTLQSASPSSPPTCLRLCSSSSRRFPRPRFAARSASALRRSATSSSATPSVPPLASVALNDSLHVVS